MLNSVQVKIKERQILQQTSFNTNVPSFTEPNRHKTHSTVSNGSPKNNDRDVPKAYGDTAYREQSILLFYFRVQTKETWAETGLNLITRTEVEHKSSGISHKPQHLSVISIHWDIMCHH